MFGKFSAVEPHGFFAVMADLSELFIGKTKIFGIQKCLNKRMTQSVAVVTLFLRQMLLVWESIFRIYVP